MNKRQLHMVLESTLTTAVLQFLADHPGMSFPGAVVFLAARGLRAEGYTIDTSGPLPTTARGTTRRGLRKARNPETSAESA